MRKRMLLWINILLLMALLSGCTLAQPEFSGNAGGDTFCGFWLIYDRQENESSHVFDINSDTEQMMLEYMIMPGDGVQDLTYATKAGSSVGGAAASLSYKDDGVEIEIKGTIYLLDNEDQSALEQGCRQVWLNGDVVQSFRDFYVQPPEGASGEDVLKSGETIIVYIPQEQIGLHGTELKELAQSLGAHLILKSESPRMLRIAPVFERPDGTVYADESGVHFTVSAFGSSFSQTVENTETLNGKTTKKKVTAEISVQWLDELKTVRLVEINSQNVPVRSWKATAEDIKVWTKKEKPYQAGKDAAYLIVEETYETKQGTAYVKRTVYDRPQSNDLNRPAHTFHFPMENGLTETVQLSIGFQP